MSDAANTITVTVSTQFTMSQAHFTPVHDGICTDVHKTCNLRVIISQVINSTQTKNSKLSKTHRTALLIKSNPDGFLLLTAAIYIKGERK